MFRQKCITLEGIWGHEETASSRIVGIVPHQHSDMAQTMQCQILIKLIN